MNPHGWTRTMLQVTQTTLISLTSESLSWSAVALNVSFIIQKSVGWITKYLPVFGIQGQVFLHPQLVQTDGELLRSEWLLPRQALNWSRKFLWSQFCQWTRIPQLHWNALWHPEWIEGTEGMLRLTFHFTPIKMQLGSTIRSNFANFVSWLIQMRYSGKTQNSLAWT